MTAVLAAAEPTDWGRALVGLAFGAAGMWIGARCWQGRFPGAHGPQPAYQSYFGGAFLAAPFGLAFALLSLAELIRGVAGGERDGGFFVAVSVVVLALLAATALGAIAYFWTGVPSRWRPPYQRDRLRARQ